VVRRELGEGILDTISVVGICDMERNMEEEEEEAEKASMWYVWITR
jgi:hypothetical protein